MAARRVQMPQPPDPPADPVQQPEQQVDEAQQQAVNQPAAAPAPPQLDVQPQPAEQLDVYTPYSLFHITYVTNVRHDLLQFY